ncbi:hypothetical protein AXF42_Ash016667 [Apostasia shenzhenica]|uniref:Uncharacterized protein n=1 Tax=Apostasia shenzhenica TaxID=1088818 RepID=A0A2I0A1R4_9ASPA|nr:hypothetical protein AXF42_Ash016667 [Apostasia shenzhenica]
MYMAVRYGFDSPDGSHVLRLSDSPSSSKFKILWRKLQTRFEDECSSPMQASRAMAYEFSPAFPHRCAYAEDEDPTAPQPLDHRSLSDGGGPCFFHPISVCAKGYSRLSPPADALFPPRSRARSQKNAVKWRKYPCLCGSYGTTTAAISFVVIMFLIRMTKMPSHEAARNLPSPIQHV